MAIHDTEVDSITGGEGLPLHIGRNTPADAKLNTYIHNRILDPFPHPLHFLNGRKRMEYKASSIL